MVTGGTLGCFVKRYNDDAYYILSNNHILANINECSINDPVFQPGKIDGGQTADTIARLADYEPLKFTGDNLYDAAIARLDMSPTDMHVPGIGRLSGTTSPVVDARVQKTGRSSDLTSGLIITRNIDIEVDFGNNRKLVFRDQFEIEGRNEEGLVAGFSAGGDSGSLVIESGSMKAVGLLFAGDDMGSSYASPIEPIFSRFNVFLA